MRFHQWWLSSQPDPDNGEQIYPFPVEEPETQVTQPLPVPVEAPAITPDEYRGRIVYPDNCVMCLREFAEQFDVDNLPYEAGSYGLCFEHQNLLLTAKPEELELLRPYLLVLYRRYDPYN